MVHVLFVACIEARDLQRLELEGDRRWQGELLEVDEIKRMDKS